MVQGIRILKLLNRKKSYTCYYIIVQTVQLHTPTSFESSIYSQVISIHRTVVPSILRLPIVYFIIYYNVATYVVADTSVCYLLPRFFMSNDYYLTTCNTKSIL